MTTSASASAIRDPRGPGDLLGRYQLLERVGEGGMGVVWRCFDLELEEEVAIKFLREEFGRDEGLRALFRREVKLARRVTHANVARVFELGRDGDAYFLTMEYIAGESLHDQLTWLGPMPPRRVPGFAVSLCRGLAAAHAVSVVHGDIKPGNILIDPARGAVLTDFGISRALSEANSFDADSSGTPLYMPPERLAGEPFTLTSDVYAVGVVLFETLTGKPPWTETDLTDLMHAKCLRGELDLGRIAPELAPGWRALISDCLRFDPDARPSDAAALLTRLSPLYTTEVLATPVRPPPAPLASPKAATWVRVAKIEGEQAGRDVAWLTGDLVAALTRVRGLRVATGQVPTPRSAATPPLTRIGGAVHTEGDGVLVSVDIAGVDGVPVHIEMHRPNTGLHNLGVDLAAEIVAAISPEQIGAVPARHAELDAEAAELYVRAREADMAMQPGVALERYAQALTRAPDHALLRLGQALAQVKATFMVREPEPREVDRARQLAEDVVARQPEVGEAHLAMAGVRLCLNDPIGCARSLRAALRRAPGLIRAHGVVADLLIDIGRLPDAERRLEIAAALAGDDLETMLHRIRLRAYQGRWDEYYALLEGPLARARLRTVASLRMAMWQPESGPLQRLERAIAANVDGLPPAHQRDAHDVVCFALGQGDRHAIFARLAAAYPGSSRSRYARIFAQLQCEMACTLGELDRASELLGRADGLALIDWHWLAYCPSLAPLREVSWFPSILARVRGRADAVAEAIWDWTSP